MNCPQCNDELIVNPTGANTIILHCNQCNADYAPEPPARKITCKDCKAIHRVERAQRSIATNGEMTTIVILHPKPIVCECGAVYLDVVDESTLRIETKPRQVQGADRRIWTPGQNNNSKVM